MRRVRLYILCLLIVVGILALGCAAPSEEEKGTTTTSETMEIKWGVSLPGTAGYRTAGFVTKAIESVYPNYKFYLYTYKGSGDTLRGLLLGEVDVCYGPPDGIRDAYEHTGVAKGIEQPKKLPAQTMWLYTAEVVIITSPKYAEEIKSWKDLDGKPVFVHLPWTFHYHAVDALKKIGINIKPVDLDRSMIS